MPFPLPILSYFLSIPTSLNPPHFKYATPHTFSDLCSFETFLFSDSRVCVFWLPMVWLTASLEELGDLACVKMLAAAKGWIRQLCKRLANHRGHALFLTLYFFPCFIVCEKKFIAHITSQQQTTPESNHPGCCQRLGVSLCDLRVKLPAPYSFTCQGVLFELRLKTRQGMNINEHPWICICLLYLFYTLVYFSFDFDFKQIQRWWPYLLILGHFRSWQLAASGPSDST